MRTYIAPLVALALCTSVLLAGDDEPKHRAVKKYEQFMERAHPTPTMWDDAFRPWLLQVPEASNAFFENVATTVEEQDQLPVQNESSIAVNPTNPLNLVASAVDYRSASATWVYVSHDGGKTWENLNLDRPFPGWRSSNDPSVTFDENGRAYLCYGGFGEEGRNGVFISYSDDEGKTWTAHIPVILHNTPQNADSTFEDKYYVHVDNSADSPYRGRVYIPWKRVTARDSATQIVLSTSDDRGVSWSKPVNVSLRESGTSEDTTFGQSFPLTRTGPNGEVYTVWNHGPEHSIGFSSSADGGETWSSPRLIATYDPMGTTLKIPEGSDSAYRHTVKGKVRAESYPTLMVDNTDGPRRGWMYLCWTADPIPQIYFMRSEDGGETWTTPKKVSPEGTNDQWWPWLSLDPTNGDLAVMFLDSRDDPENYWTNCYVSYSNDGGDTWISRRAADQQSDVTLNPFGGNSFSGDYSGNAFYNGIVYPSWFDTRSNRMTDSDVYTAIVNTRAPQPPTQLEATADLANPEQGIELSWVSPTERTFGQPMSFDEYTILIKRDGEVLTELSPELSVYLDDDVQPYTMYDYDVLAVAGPDSSKTCSISFAAGGSRKPGVPELRYFSQDPQYLRLHMALPEFRADGYTEFINPRTLNLYLVDTDNTRSLFKTFDISVDDLGTIKSYTIDHCGWELFGASISDSDSPSNESDMINFGMRPYFYPLCLPMTHALSLEDNRDSLIRMTGAFQTSTRFKHSGTHALTISPNGPYGINQRDTAFLPPLILGEDGNGVISFMHAAIVHENDEAVLEYTTDFEEWSVAAEFDRSQFPEWTDGVLDANDFKHFVYEYSRKADEYFVFFRLRFLSNFAGNDEGWFIDDITYNDWSVDVETESSEALLVPNPAAESVTLTTQLAVQEVRLIGAHGSVVVPRWEQHGQGLYVSLANIVQGAYTLLALDRSGRILHTEFLRVIK